MTKKYKKISILLLIVFFLAQLSSWSFFLPQKAHAGSLTSVFATLGNSRLSFYGKTSGSHARGVSTITIKTTGSADNNTNNLFPGDNVAVGLNGIGMESTVLKVATVSAAATSFAIDQALVVTVPDNTDIYATQSGLLTVTFTLTNNIPANGYVLVTLPSNASNGNDKAPDTSTTTATNGFDANGITAASDIAILGGTGCTWGTETWTAATSSKHTYKVVTTTECTGGTPVVTFNASPGLINPAPVTTGHTQGVADTYNIIVETFDSGNNLIDNARTMVAPVEGVLVTANILETISFTVAGVNSGTSTCGQNTTMTTTATAIPFGTLSSPNIATGSQKLTVSTNAKSYIVTLEENDQLSLDGLGTTIIADAICDGGACTHATSADWKTGYNPAVGNFGYSMANVSGTNAAFLFNESSRIFSSKQLAENGVDFTPPSTPPPTIMSAAAPVNGSQVYVCYVLAFQVTQTAGYYYNKLRYTATPTF